MPVPVAAAASGAICGWPGDLVKGFLRLPFATSEGTRHTYDNSAAFILARMVERVAGCGLAEFLDERLFTPMGIDHAEWDRVGSSAAFGFHGLHLRTEAVAAFGELLLRGGLWGDKQPLPREWVELATGRHTDSRALRGRGRTGPTSCAVTATSSGLHATVFTVAVPSASTAWSSRRTISWSS